MATIDNLVYSLFPGAEPPVAVVNTYSDTVENPITAPWNLVIPPTITVNGTTYNVIIINNGAFSQFNKLTSVVIPDTIQEIRTSAFDRCGNMTSLNLGSGVTTLGTSCFRFCPLQTIYFQSPNTPLTSVGTTIFGEGLPTLQTVTYYYSNDVNSLNEPMTTLKNTYFTSSETQFIYDTSCFNKGTKILCKENGKEKWINVEDLTIDTLVKTYLHGYKNVKRIGKGTAMNNPKKITSCMYKLKKGTYPELFEDLILMGGHSIMVNYMSWSEKQKLLSIGFDQTFDDKQLLLSSASKKFEQITDFNEYTYYNFALESETGDQRFGVYANGILCETPSVNSFDKYCSKGFQKIWKGENINSQTIDPIIKKVIRKTIARKKLRKFHLFFK